MRTNRIVVIEDDPALLRGLAEQLRVESYDVLTAADGSDGYRLVRDNQPDLVILDLTLPGMNGYDICREVRSHGLVTPILILTAQGREVNRVRGFEVGADDYVTKPFSMRELLGRVRAVLRRSEGRSDLANQQELDEARRIQRRLMPSDIPQATGLHIAATWRPARIVGGDYFDILKVDDDVLAICIGDVCGKGMPAAMVMASLQAAVKVYAAKQTNPREVCREVNLMMYEGIAAQRFISFFYALIDSRLRQMTYCNAGHNPPILTAGSSVRHLACGGGVLGVMDHWHYEEEQVGLRSGDRLVMYTDGLIECRNEAGEEFGEERLTSLVTCFGHNDAGALVEEAIGAASRFTGGNFQDDVTVIAVSVE
ncbi:MAG TPA: SpoIIE family protein phosphatase [Vicinamibacterales bacterium]|nr:SpoIIE family protein phosphatase [Vicinamibacterales bacterium]